MSESTSTKKADNSVKNSENTKKSAVGNKADHKDAKDRPPSKAPIKANIPAPKVPNPKIPRGISVKTKMPLKESPNPTATNMKPVKANNKSKLSPAEQIQQRLKKKSPWYDSIMDPISGAGVKIPDPVGTETGTYQHVQNVTVQVNNAGQAGLRIVSPYINSFSNGLDNNGLNFQVTLDPPTTTELLWGGAPGTIGYNFAVVPPLMKANARTHRVVSCAVIAQPEVSTVADSGEMCAFLTPYGVRNYTTFYTSYQSQWDSTMIPINTHKPVIARWYPLESEFKYYDGQIVDPDAEGDMISYRDFIDPNAGLPENDRGVIPWEVGVVAVGLPFPSPGSPFSSVVRFQIIVNYEFIPLLSTAMVSSEASPIDPMEEQLVNGWVGDKPMTAVISQAQASKSPSPSTVKEEPSGFGMLFNVIEEFMPLIQMGLAALV